MSVSAGPLPGESRICSVNSPKPASWYRFVTQELIIRSRRQGRSSKPAFASTCGAFALLELKSNWVPYRSSELTSAKLPVVTSKYRESIFGSLHKNWPDKSSQRNGLAVASTFEYTLVPRTPYDCRSVLSTSVLPRTGVRRSPKFVPLASAVSSLLNAVPPCSSVT